MNDDFLNDDFADAEFDKWLAHQLKSTMVSAPEDFSSKVLIKLESPAKKGSIDPVMLFILFGILVVNVIFIAYPYILTEKWVLKISSLLFFESPTSLPSANIIIAVTTVVGLMFVGLDYMLSKKFGNSNVIIA
jgi:hypothetical protein